MLDTEERVEMVRRVKQMAAPDRLIIAGSGCECEYMFPDLLTSHDLLIYLSALLVYFP